MLPKVFTIGCRKGVQDTIKIKEGKKVHDKTDYLIISYAAPTIVYTTRIVSDFRGLSPVLRI